MRRTRGPRLARATRTAWAACALGLLATPAARAEAPVAPPPEPPPPSLDAPASPPPASSSVPPAAAAPATPTPAPPRATPPAPPPAPASAPGAPPGPAPAYPYPYPYAWPPPPYPYAAAPPGYAYPGPAPGYPAYPSYPGYPTASTAPGPVESLTATAPPPGSARVPADDPEADRGVLLPTAYTHPKGTYFFSDYDVVLTQVGYAFTDDTQLSLTGIPPLGAEQVAFVDLTLKTSLYRGGLVRVAALGSTSGLVAKELGVLGIGRVGGVAQLCLEARCDSSLSISSNVTLAGVMLMVNGVSGIFRMGQTMSLLAELDSLVPLGREAAEINGAMAGGGVRWRGTSWGFDLALMRVIGKGKPTIPILALTYRSGG